MFPTSGSHIRPVTLSQQQLTFTSQIRSGWPNQVQPPSQTVVLTPQIQPDGVKSETQECITTIPLKYGMKILTDLITADQCCFMRSKRNDFLRKHNMCTVRDRQRKPNNKEPKLEEPIKSMYNQLMNETAEYLLSQNNLTENNVSAYTRQADEKKKLKHKSKKERKLNIVPIKYTLNTLKGLLNFDDMRSVRYNETHFIIDSLGLSLNIPYKIRAKLIEANRSKINQFTNDYVGDLLKKKGISEATVTANNEKNLRDQQKRKRNNRTSASTSQIQPFSALIDLTGSTSMQTDISSNVQDHQYNRESSSLQSQKQTAFPSQDKTFSSSHDQTASLSRNQPASSSQNQPASSSQNDPALSSQNDPASSSQNDPASSSQNHSALSSQNQTENGEIIVLKYKMRELRGLLYRADQVDVIRKKRDDFLEKHFGKEVTQSNPDFVQYMQTEEPFKSVFNQFMNEMADCVLRENNITNADEYVAKGREKLKQVKYDKKQDNKQVFRKYTAIALKGLLTENEMNCIKKEEDNFIINNLKITHKVPNKMRRHLLGQHRMEIIQFANDSVEEMLKKKGISVETVDANRSKNILLQQQQMQEQKRIYIASRRTFVDTASTFQLDSMQSDILSSEIEDQQCNNFEQNSIKSEEEPCRIETPTSQLLEQIKQPVSTSQIQIDSMQLDISSGIDDQQAINISSSLNQPASSSQDQPASISQAHPDDEISQTESGEIVALKYKMRELRRLLKTEQVDDIKTKRDDFLEKHFGKEVTQSNPDFVQYLQNEEPFKSVFNQLMNEMADSCFRENNITHADEFVAKGREKLKQVKQDNKQVFRKYTAIALKGLLTENEMNCIMKEEDNFIINNLKITHEVPNKMRRHLLELHNTKIIQFSNNNVEEMLKIRGIFSETVHANRLKNFRIQQQKKKEEMLKYSCRTSVDNVWRSKMQRDSKQSDKLSSHIRDQQCTNFKHNSNKSEVEHCRIGTATSQLPEQIKRPVLTSQTQLDSMQLDISSDIHDQRGINIEHSSIKSEEEPCRKETPTSQLLEQIKQPVSTSQTQLDSMQLGISSDIHDKQGINIEHNSIKSEEEHRRIETPTSQLPEQIKRPVLTSQTQLDSMQLDTSSDIHDQQGIAIEHNSNKSEEEPCRIETPTSQLLEQLKRPVSTSQIQIDSMQLDISCDIHDQRCSNIEHNSLKREAHFIDQQHSTESPAVSEILPETTEMKSPMQLASTSQADVMLSQLIESGLKIPLTHDIHILRRFLTDDQIKLIQSRRADFLNKHSWATANLTWAKSKYLWTRPSLFLRHPKLTEPYQSVYNEFMNETIGGILRKNKITEDNYVEYSRTANDIVKLKKDFKKNKKRRRMLISAKYSTNALKGLFDQNETRILKDKEKVFIAERLKIGRDIPTKIRSDLIQLHRNEINEFLNNTVGEMLEKKGISEETVNANREKNIREQQQRKLDKLSVGIAESTDTIIKDDSGIDSMETDNTNNAHYTSSKETSSLQLHDQLQECASTSQTKPKNIYSIPPLITSRIPPPLMTFQFQPTGTITQNQLNRAFHQSQPSSSLIVLTESESDKMQTDTSSGLQDRSWIMDELVSSDSEEETFIVVDSWGE